MTTTARRTALITRQTAQTVSALGLALLLTLATLGSLNHLATAQHGAFVLARAAAVQQTQALTLSAARS
jgi:hypothetical protein